MIMFILAIFLIVTSGSCIEIEVDLECNTCVLLNNTCYNITHLLDLEAPFRNRVVIHKMEVLMSENILYFSFEPTIEDEEYYKVGFVNLDNPNFKGVISGGARFINNFGTFAIDQDNGLVYLGGDDGIFALSTATNIMTPYSSRGDTITTLFYKNNVYFVKYEDKGVIVKKGDYFKTLFENIPIKKFIVIKNEIVVFLNSYGLYVGKAGNVFRISNNPFYRGLCVDLDGMVYAWWIDGIYKVIVEKNLVRSKIVKVSHLPSIGAMTFDNENNILFTMDRALYRMTATNYNCTMN